MTTDEAIHLLKNFNAWRCGADTPMLNPREITEAINTVTGELHLLEENKKLNARLDAGHEYLMTTNSLNLTIEDALEAFGFRRDDLK